MKDRESIIKRFNQKNFMPVIWLTLLGLIIWIICPLVHLSVVWRIGLVFFIFDSILSYEIGHLIAVRHVNKWWILLFPIVFALVVTIHYATYNYLLCIVYICMELFGLWRDDFYHEIK